MDTDKNLLLLFERPGEPLDFFLHQNGLSLEEGLEDISLAVNDLKPRPLLHSARSDKIPISDKIDVLPKISDEILKLDKKENFSLFIPKHRAAAAKLIDILYNVPDRRTFELLAKDARDKVNPYLFNYAVSVAILHRPDTQDLNIPSLVQSFPDKYIPGNIYEDIKKNNALRDNEKYSSLPPLEVPITATDLEEENRLAYFREDVGVNLHHWHWHLVYPMEGDEKIVKKDRRGELFYYMHQQMLARYNFERFCNRLKRVERLSDWSQPIKEAYFPKLQLSNSSKNYASRPANQYLYNVNRRNKTDGSTVVDIDEMRRWSQRIYDAIDCGHVVDRDGNIKVLTDEDGIDILGNIVEAAQSLSPNPKFYGDLHNQGHNMISCIHDPDGRHLEDFGVMADTSTAMRDPVFYRWHAFIDHIFQHHKNTLEPYKEAQLAFNGVKIESVEVQSEECWFFSEKNAFCTFWQKSVVDINIGLNFAGPKRPTSVKFTHLQHKPFAYKIRVRRETAGAMKGTCRIFLAPKLDEAGHEMDFGNQRQLFIELDKFTVTLDQEEKVITRRSTESSVTLPFEKVFNPKAGDQTNFCACGWPHHMLIPKGTSDGTLCQLFVMISDHRDDVVHQDMTGVCTYAESFCGVKNKLYPDRRSMGFPFDRQPREGVKTVYDFCTGIDNMTVRDVKIKFNNHTDEPLETTPKSS